MWEIYFTLLVPQDPCMVYFPTFFVAFNGIKVGRYIRHMDPVTPNVRIQTHISSSFHSERLFFRASKLTHTDPHVTPRLQIHQDTLGYIRIPIYFADFGCILTYPDVSW